VGPHFAARDGRWIVKVFDAAGTCKRVSFADEDEADEYVRGAHKTTLGPTDLTTEVAIEKYVDYLTAKGNKRTSIEHTAWALRRFFDDARPVWAITAAWCHARYSTLAKELAVDSHRGILAQCKTFATWIVKNKWLRKNPLADIEGVGRRRRGKDQLRLTAARLFLSHAIHLAKAGDHGAIAAIMSLLLGMRSSEIVTCLVRDLDENEKPCDMLWIHEGETANGQRSIKTFAGNRTLDVPEPLRSILAEHVKCRPLTDPLFPADPRKLRPRGPSENTTGNPPAFHYRSWVLHAVKRICAELKIPEVTAHSMRGLHATLAIERGATGRVVADSLGHSDERTTLQSYAKPRAVKRAMHARSLELLTPAKRAE